MIIYESLIGVFSNLRHTHIHINHVGKLLPFEFHGLSTRNHHGIFCILSNISLIISIMNHHDMKNIHIQEYTYIVSLNQYEAPFSNHI